MDQLTLDIRHRGGENGYWGTAPESARGAFPTWAECWEHEGQGVRRQHVHIKLNALPVPSCPAPRFPRLSHGLSTLPLLGIAQRCPGCNHNAVPLISLRPFWNIPWVAGLGKKEGRKQGSLEMSPKCPGSRMHSPSTVSLQGSPICFHFPEKEFKNKLQSCILILKN